MKSTPSENTSIPLEIYSDEESIRKAFYWFIAIIMLTLSGSAVIAYSSNDIVTTIIVAFSILPVCSSYFLVRHGKFEWAAVFLSLVLMFAITVVGTLGLGIHHISNTAYALVLAGASLIVQRKTLVVLTLITIGCIAWLVFGELLEIYHPALLEKSVLGDFFSTSLIIIATLIVVYSLSQMVSKSHSQLAAELARREIAEAKLRYQSIHDVLTGIYNRTFFEEELARMELGREFPISIIIADVDGLKLVNDTYGHAAGDDLLRRTAGIFSGSFRAGDVVARIGGDEFAVLLPSTDSTTVDQILQRIRTKESEHNISHTDIPAMLSLGVSTVDQGSLVNAMKIADQRMYADKALRKSKNQVD